MCVLLVMLLHTYIYSYKHVLTRTDFALFFFLLVLVALGSLIKARGKGAQDARKLLSGGLIIILIFANTIIINVIILILILIPIITIYH